MTDTNDEAAKSGERALQPCPFCGGEPEIINCSVHCNNPFCEAQPYTAGQSKREAVAAWNRRAAIAQSPTQAGAVQAASKLLAAVKATPRLPAQSLQDDPPVMPAPPADGGAQPTHEQVMAGYAVSCKFGVYEAQAFKLAEEMYRAMHATAAPPAQPAVDAQWMKEVERLADALTLSAIAHGKALAANHADPAGKKLYDAAESAMQHLARARALLLVHLRACPAAQAQERDSAAGVEPTRGGGL